MSATYRCKNCGKIIWDLWHDGQTLKGFIHAGSGTAFCEPMRARFDWDASDAFRGPLLALVSWEDQAKLREEMDCNGETEEQ